MEEREITALALWAQDYFETLLRMGLNVDQAAKQVDIAVQGAIKARHAQIAREQAHRNTLQDSDGIPEDKSQVRTGGPEDKETSDEEHPEDTAKVPQRVEALHVDSGFDGYIVSDSGWVH